MTHQPDTTGMGRREWIAASLKWKLPFASRHALPSLLVMPSLLLKCFELPALHRQRVMFHSNWAENSRPPVGITRLLSRTIRSDWHWCGPVMSATLGKNGIVQTCGFWLFFLFKFKCLEKYVFFWFATVSGHVNKMLNSNNTASAKYQNQMNKYLESHAAVLKV